VFEILSSSLSETLKKLKKKNSNSGDLIAINTSQCIRKTTSYISTDINAPPFKKVLSTFYQLNWRITNNCNQIL
jgi:hypothetical protein